MAFKIAMITLTLSRFIYDRAKLKGDEGSGSSDINKGKKRYAYCNITT